MDRSSSSYLIIPLGVLALVVTMMGGAVFGQVIGPEAEMDRLEEYANEAISKSDPDGAAMNMGKAALMASELAKETQDAEQAELLRGAAQLYRAQEHAYRAWALFEQAGGIPPASSGVCATIRQAEQHVGKAVSILADRTSLRYAPGWNKRVAHWSGLATEWVATIRALQEADFECS